MLAMDCLYQTNPICVRAHIAVPLMARLAAPARPDLLGPDLDPTAQVCTLGCSRKLWPASLIHRGMMCYQAFVAHTLSS